MSLNNRNTRYEYNKNPLVIGTSDSAKYIPVYCHPKCSNPNYIGSTSVLIYHKIQNTTYGNKLSYDDIIICLNDSPWNQTTEGASFKIEDQTHWVGLYKGYICDPMGNILLILTYKSDGEPFERDGIHFDQLLLFISREFLLNPIYKNMYKKIYELFILPLIESNVDVIYTDSDSIENIVFVNAFKVEFNSITELCTHLEIEVPKVVNFIENPIVESDEYADDDYAEVDEDLPF